MTLSDRDTQIVTLYKAGLKVPEIAYRVRRTTAHVNKVLGCLNLKRPPRRRKPKAAPAPAGALEE